MKSEPRFTFPRTGPGRPQILLVGNGLEQADDTPRAPDAARKSKSWAELLMALMAPDPVKTYPGEPDLLTDEGEKRAKMDSVAAVPFPLQYQLLSTSRTAPCPLPKSLIDGDLERLRAACRDLGTVTNPQLRRLPALGADHVFTTNYTYSLERAFLPDRDPERRGTDFQTYIMKEASRSRLRFNRNPERTAQDKPKRETVYRLHSGYAAQNADGSPVGLWHIHGESTVADGIILGHDGYGRLLSRIVTCCAGKALTLKTEGEDPLLGSWPALFLFGDVYILGFGMALSEFDLWWLLRRKQREQYADGRVYFYDNGQSPRDRERNLLLRAHGVLVNEGVSFVPPSPDGSHYARFYDLALEEIARRIAANRAAGGRL